MPCSKNCRRTAPCLPASIALTGRLAHTTTHPYKTVLFDFRDMVFVTFMTPFPYTKEVCTRGSLVALGHLCTMATDSAMRCATNWSLPPCVPVYLVGPKGAGPMTCCWHNYTTLTHSTRRTATAFVGHWVKAVGASRAGHAGILICRCVAAGVPWLWLTGLSAH